MAFVSSSTSYPTRRHSIRPKVCNNLSARTLFIPSFVKRTTFQHANSTHPFRDDLYIPTACAPYPSPSPTKISSSSSSPPKILISGAPASGKGTQCELLVSHYNVVHLSTGDMLRAAVKAGTPLGKQAKAFMDAGDLVPDDLVISLLKERLSSSDVREKGWLLDGFPRTAVQAQALDDAGILPDAVLVLDVPDDVLIERVVGRRLDPETGKIYHVKFNPPPQDDLVQSRLIRRSDDTEEKAQNRLKNYYTHAQSIISHYAKKVQNIDGNRPKLDVFNQLVQIIDDSGSDNNDDNNDEPPTSTTSASNESSSSSSSSAKGLSVSEFVRRAEEAYESGALETKDVKWSGQAGLDDETSLGTSSYADVTRRLDLASGDALMILLFAYIGRATHGDSAIDLGLLKTSLPFLTAWFLTTPLLGVYTRAATSSMTTTVQTLARSWAVAIPMGIALRAVVTQHVPPTTFTVITLATNLTLLTSWRIAYVKIRGEDSKDGIRGGIFDGFKMITTLLQRW